MAVVFSLIIKSLICVFGCCYCGGGSHKKSDRREKTSAIVGRLLGMSCQQLIISLFASLGTALGSGGLLPSRTSIEMFMRPIPSNGSLLVSTC